MWRQKLFHNLLRKPTIYGATSPLICNRDLQVQTPDQTNKKMREKKNTWILNFNIGEAWLHMLSWQVYIHPRNTSSLKVKTPHWMKDILTLNFNPRPFNPRFLNHELFNPGLFNPRLFNHELFNPRLFNPALSYRKSGVGKSLRSLGLKSSWLKSLGLKSPGLESSWLKNLGLKGPGLKLGVEKSRVEMSFNLHIVHLDLDPYKSWLQYWHYWLLKRIKSRLLVKLKKDYTWTEAIYFSDQILEEFL